MQNTHNTHNTQFGIAKYAFGIYFCYIVYGLVQEEMCVVCVFVVVCLLFAVCCCVVFVVSFVVFFVCSSV